MTLLDHRPTLNDSFLHRKMCLLDIYGDCLWYRVGARGIACTKGGYAIVDCDCSCPGLKDMLLALGITGVLTNSSDFTGGKTLMQVQCSGEKQVHDTGVFDICKQISAVFDIPFDDLYTRVSHAVRHQHGGVYRHESSVAYVAFGVLEGVCSTLPGRGDASALLKQIMKSCSGTLYCLCDSALVPFYQKNGFAAVQTLTEETLR